MVINSTADRKQNQKGYLFIEPSTTSKSRTCSLYISIIWTPTLYSMTSFLVFDIWNKSHKARKFTPQVSLVFKSYPLYQIYRNFGNMLKKWMLYFLSIQATCSNIINKNTHYHGVSLPWSSLPICKDAHVITIKYRPDQWLNVCVYLFCTFRKDHL